MRFRMTGGGALDGLASRHRAVDAKDVSRMQRIALQVIPATQLRHRHAVIVGDGKNCVAFAHFVNGGTLRVRDVFRLAARRDGNDEPHSRFQIVARVEIIHLRNRGCAGLVLMGDLGQGFAGTLSVSFNGTPATFTVYRDTFLVATVPAGASTGSVTVTTPTGTLTSNDPFRVMP